MAEEKKDERGFDNYIPVWDGRADSLREFRKSVQWWLCSINLEKTTDFNLAARFAMRQKGSAKLRALEFEPKELEYKPAVTQPDPATGDEAVVSEAVYDAGIQKILDAWEDMVGRSHTDRKGELRERFYLTMKRGITESIPNFALRYRTLVAEMKAEGITIDAGEQAWFFKQKLQLTEMQKQMLETTLGANTEDYAECEKESIRLFKRVHYGAQPRPGHGPFQRRPTPLTSSTLSRFRRSLPSSSSSTASTWKRGGRSSSTASAYVTEGEIMDDDGEDPGEDAEVFEAVNEADEGEDAGEDEEFHGLQSMLEVMATEMDEAAEAGADEEVLAGLEEKMDDAVEALVTLREARSQINGLKKDRGYHGGKSGGKGKKKSNFGGKSNQTSSCFICGEQGHWQGDPECKGPKTPDVKFPRPMRKNYPPSGKSRSGSHTPKTEVHSAEVNVVDFLADNRVMFSGTDEVHEINMIEVHDIPDFDYILDKGMELTGYVADVQPETEVLMTQNLAEALATSTGVTGLEPDKRYIAAVDTACNKTCAGQEWLELMIGELQKAPPWIYDLVAERETVDHFRFGNGGTLQSGRRVRLPVCLAGQVVLLWISAIPCNSLGCLLGKDLLESLGAMMDVAGKKLQLRFLSDEWLTLQRMRAGHSSLTLLPRDMSNWPQLSEMSWHAVGLGGVVEVQCEGKMTWKARKMSILKAPEESHGELHFTMNYIPEHCISSTLTSDEGYGSLSPSHCSILAAMAENAGSLGSSSSMALAGSASMADPTTLPALPPIPSADGGDGGGLARAVEGCGEEESMAEILVAEGYAEDEHAPSSRRSDSPSPSRTGSGIHGGRRHHVRAEDVEEEAPSEAASGSDLRDSPRSARAGWPQRRAGKRIARAPGWITTDEGRTDQARDAGGSRGQGDRHGGGLEAEDQAGDGRDHESWKDIPEGYLVWSKPIAGESTDAGDSPTGRSSSSFHTSSASIGFRPGPRPRRELRADFPDVGFSPDDDERLGSPSADDATRVLPAEHRDGSRTARLSVGSLNNASFEKLKPGVKVLINVKQAVRKAQRLRQKLGAPLAYVMEVLETQYLDFLEDVSTGAAADNFMTEFIIPGVPNKPGFRHLWFEQQFLHLNGMWWMNGVLAM